MSDFDPTAPLRPHDPRGLIDGAVTLMREQDDDLLTWRLQACIERLRNSLRSVAPEANITDTFEGIDAAAIALVLKERHG